MIRALFARLLVVALCLLPSQGQAYWQSVAQQVSDLDVSNTDSACIASSGTTTTFSSKKLGGTKTGRILVVSINWDDSTAAGTAEITGVTIGGNTMARATRAVGDDQNSNSEIWYAQVSTGTTGDVVVTSSTAIDGMTIAIYRLINFQSIAPASLATGTTTATASGLASGYATIAAGSRRTNVSTSLDNLTNDFSSACGSSLWGVHGSALASGSSLTTTISPTTSTPLIAIAAWASGTSCADPNWANVILLLPLDGANGATTSTDVSPSARALTFTNGAALSTAQSIFGVSSASFDGTNDLITVPDSTDWDFTGAFTIEVAFRPTSTTGNATRTLIAKRNAASSNISWNLDWFAAASTTIGFEFSTDGTNIAHTLSASVTITANTWNWAAVTRGSDNTMRLYFNGTVVASKASATGTPFNSTNALSIGARANTGAPNIGFEDEIRVTAGVDRYGGSYTTPTAPFPICQ